MSVMNMWPGACVIIRGGFGVHRHRLRGYAASPEDRDLAVIEFDGVAEVWGVDVADADCCRIADMYGSAMHGWEAGCYLHCANYLLLRDGGALRRPWGR